MSIFGKEDPSELAKMAQQINKNGAQNKKSKVTNKTNEELEITMTPQEYFKSEEMDPLDVASMA